MVSTANDNLLKLRILSNKIIQSEKSVESDEDKYKEMLKDIKRLVDTGTPLPSDTGERFITCESICNRLQIMLKNFKIT